jgi:hypothetical protein
MPTKLKLNFLLATCWIISILMLLSTGFLGNPDEMINASATILWLSMGFYLAGMLVPLVLLFKVWSLLDGVKFAIDYRTIIPYLTIPVFGFFWAFKIYASLPKALKVFFQHNGVSKIKNYSVYLKCQGMLLAVALGSLGSASFASTAGYPSKVVDLVIMVSIWLAILQSLFSFFSVSVLHNLHTSIVKLHVSKFMESSHQMTESEAEKYRVSMCGENQ